MDFVERKAMTLPKKVLPLAMAIFLGACNAVIVEDLPGPRFSYFDGDFELASHKGSVIAIVTGNPFSLNQKQFASLVRNSMKGHVNVATEARFVAARDETTVSPYRVVVSFNAPAGLGDNELCELGAKTPSVANRRDLNVRMAFCFGDSFKSGSSAWVSGVSGPDDPKFRELIQRATFSMVPGQDGEETGEDKLL
jgi:hypothetical protein